MKIASNFQFDEGFNDLPLSELTPNVISLSRTNDGDPLLMESDWSSSDDLHFIDTPFDYDSCGICVFKRSVDEPVSR